ncbi:hypothetical protein ABPG74_013428 [Tetrahymena malaccensis]
MEEYHQKLVDSFEQIISQNAVNKLEQVNSKSILELDKGIIQFNVEDRGLGQRFRVNLQQNSNKKIIFNNSHYNPIHSDAFSNSVQTVRIELKQDIQKEINQLDYNQLIDTFDHKNLSKELENQFVSISVDEFNISSKNPFSLGFQFNELTNEFKDFNYEMIDGIFKNFSTEGYTGEIIQISDKVSKNQDDHLNYKIKKYTNYSSKEQIEQDFLDLSKNFNEYCEQKEKYSPSKQQYRSIRSNKDYYQDLKMIQIIGEEKVKIFNRIYDQLNTSKVENEDLFDFDSAQKYIKSSYESDVKKKNLKNLQYKGKEVNEIIEQARMRVQNDQFVYDNQNDEISNPQMFFKEAKLNEVGQVQSQIKQWAIEDDQDVSTFQDKLPKEKMAINYPFELDNFQKRSILRLEQGQNVFVCAPTSAGKTLVAEYSIALSKKHKRRVIYVSPIKSLSNQKYRDFKEKFGDDVGIITGDISLNPSASCLIVTTEVLRNMLYKANHIVREFAWVIFDEVHNINNQYRGVVWEEAIILLPENIGLVMLSATVPNYMEFADWVGRTKQRKIYVQKTLNRPVPLEHSIYYDGKIFVIKQANEGFNQENYEKINKYLKDQQNKQKAVVSEKDKLKQEKKDKEIYKNTNLSQNAKEKQKLIQEKFIKKTSMTNGSLTEAQQIKNLLKYCQENELLPCIVFTFSKNTIKELSESLGNLNLINHEESKQIEEFFNKASHKLKTTDLEVSQIRTLKDLIMRGIAVHHSDVIPFIKEIKNKKQFLDEYKQVGTESNPNDKENYESIQEGFDRSLCYTCNKKNEHFKLVSQRNELQNEFDNLIKALDEDDFAEPINFQQQLFYFNLNIILNQINRSLNILKQLNYIDEENLPQLKAKLAKEIDNLYVSELIVQGIFNELNEAEIAAILIGFVTQSNKKEGEQDYDPFEDCKVHGFQYSEKFLEAYDKTLKIINQTVQLEIDNEIIIVSEIKDAIAQIFNPQLIKVAYEWVQGKDFLQVTKLQDGQEGAIIRSMLRLNNLMKNIKNSAQYIGNNSLSLKIESCQEKMRRDIIFAQSLYLEEDNKLICLKNI